MNTTTGLPVATMAADLAARIARHSDAIFSAGTAAPPHLPRHLPTQLLVLCGPYAEQRATLAVEHVISREKIMDVATTTLAERIARTLSGLEHSANAGGSEESASSSVDETWQAYLGAADAIIRAIREPSGAMSAAGDPQIWAAMVDAAIRESEAL